MATMRFGDWLKAERGFRRLSQAEVEHRADMGHSHYSKLENNKIPRPTEETRARLHAVFGTSDEDLVQAGILRPRTLRSADGVREATIYEYVDDDTAPTVEVADVGGAIPAEIAELLQGIAWTRENIDTLVPILDHIARADAATRLLDTPARSPRATRAAARVTDDT